MKLRTLRDVLLMVGGLKLVEGEVVPADGEGAAAHALKNMEAAQNYCSLWKPMPISDLENYAVQNCFDFILKSQIEERVQELKQTGAEPSGFEASSSTLIH